MKLRIASLALFFFLSAIPLTGPAMSDEVYEINLPRTEFYDATTFEIVSEDGSDAREVLIARYKSPLGSELKVREPSETELKEIRNACRFLVRLARGSDAGEFDDYFIELANGDGPVEYISSQDRTVFGFTREEGCDGPYTIVEVS